MSRPTLPLRPSDTTPGVIRYADALLDASRALRLTGPGLKASHRAFEAAMYEARQLRSLDRRRN